MSSGPDMVQDDEEVSDDIDSVVLPLSLFLEALGRGLGLAGSSGLFDTFSMGGVVLFESLPRIEVVEAITQDSPRTEPSGIRGCSDMAL